MANHGMTLSERKARVKEFNDLMEKMVSRYTDVLGPQRCTIHGDEPDIDECDDECTHTPFEAIPRTWALVTGWEITEEGDQQGFGMPDYFMPEGSMSWEIIGLLTHALDDIRGIAE
jgi:hypothetical protein